MGYAYHKLIPVSILLDNPGITKEEFATLLNETDGSEGEFPIVKKEYAKWDGRFAGLTADELTALIRRCNLVRWDLSGQKEKIRIYSDYYHGGLNGLGSLLGLKTTKRFETLQKCMIKQDSFGLMYDLPYLDWYGCKEDGIWKETEFEVSIHERGKLSEQAEFGRFDSSRKFKTGDVFNGDEIHGSFRHHYGYVERYVKERPVKNCPGTFDHAMLVRGIIKNMRKRKFSSLADLVIEYPQFKPEVVYDFSQESGNFTNILHGGETFRWINRNGKYYLDKEHMMNTIGVSIIDSCEYGYTDVVMTSQAMKKKAWKMLSYRGLQHRDNFFKRWPDTIIAYEKAGWDAHTSHYAKKNHMSVNEFLRMRLLAETESIERNGKRRAQEFFKEINGD